MEQADVLIIGAGILGLATAYQLSQTYPEFKVIVLEKEFDLAFHQTGHNSGVLHSGIYYKPGSLKAENCRLGKKAMEAFCDEEGIAFDICGKVIVATSEAELPALELIFERGRANGVKCEIVGREELQALEPHAAGIKAIHVPEAGIVDYKQVCARLSQRIQEHGHQVVFRARVTSILPQGSDLIVTSSAGDFQTNYLINCTGLHSDRVTEMSGHKPETKIVPFKGEYYELKPAARHLCKNLIYPVPDPAFPFLGVHFTRMIDNNVECGPNAVLAFGREGYGKFDINWADLADSLTYIGFRRMASKHWRTGLGEMWRSYSKRAFVEALRRLIPEIDRDHLEPAPAGIRAQAVTPDGSLVDDFLIVESENVINVCNAPSPAATASLNIGKTIVTRLEARF